jgi:hypothetical protein
VCFFVYSCIKIFYSHTTIDYLYTWIHKKSHTTIDYLYTWIYKKTHNYRLSLYMNTQNQNYRLSLYMNIQSCVGVFVYSCIKIIYSCVYSCIKIIYSFVFLCIPYGPFSFLVLISVCLLWIKWYLNYLTWLYLWLEHCLLKFFVPWESFWHSKIVWSLANCRSVI